MVPTRHAARAALAVIALLGAGLGAPRLAAEGTVAEPRQICDGILALVGRKEFDAATAEIVTRSRGYIAQAQVGPSLAKVEAALASHGGAAAATLLTERAYAGAMARYWYLLVFEGSPPVPLIAACDAVKLDDGWMVKGFAFNTNPDLVSLPDP